MERSKRVEIYTRHLKHKYSNGFARLTSAQRRRVRKHDRRFWGTIYGKNAL
jgi:hypothetical protein